jgi:hypothetical protein
LLFRLLKKNDDEFVLLQERQVTDKAVLKVEDEKMDEQGHEMDLESVGTFRYVECPYFL